MRFHSHHNYQHIKTSLMSIFSPLQSSSLTLSIFQNVHGDVEGGVESPPAFRFALK